MRYLSDQWMTAAADAVRDLPPAEDELRVVYTVTGGPEGARSYQIRFGPGPVLLEAVEPVADRVTPEVNSVRFTTDWHTATAIAQGARSAQRAFLSGDLRIGGDAGRLLDLGEHWSTLQDRLASLRDETEY